MELKTEKLRIISLSKEEFALLVEEPGKIEKALGIEPSGEKWETETQNAFGLMYNRACEHIDDFIWFTDWVVVLSSANVMVGNAGFLGAPDDTGVVELIFGIHDFYLMSGFTEELITALTDWALSQPGVNAVVSEAAEEDTFTVKALAACGFEKISNGEVSSFWQKRK